MDSSLETTRLVRGDKTCHAWDNTGFFGQAYFPLPVMIKPVLTYTFFLMLTLEQNIKHPWSTTVWKEFKGKHNFLVKSCFHAWWVQKVLEDWLSPCTSLGHYSSNFMALLQQFIFLNFIFDWLLNKDHRVAAAKLSGLSYPQFSAAKSLVSCPVNV